MTVLGKKILAQHEKEVTHIVKGQEAGKTYELNYADDKQYNYVKNLYQLHGLTPEKFPQTFKELEQQRVADLANKKPAPPQLDKTVLQEGATGFGTLAQVTGVGTANNGKNAIATAFLSVEKGVQNANLTLTIYDMTSNPVKILATKNLAVKVSNFIGIQAVGGTPTDNMMAVLAYSYTPATGGSQTPKKIVPGYNNINMKDPTVTQPVQKATHTSNQSIKIALSRGDFNRNNDDVDYWFNEGKWNDTTIIVPFVGQATFANPIKTPLADNLTVKLTVALNDGGVSTVPANMSEVLNAFSIAADGNTLLWNLPANGSGEGTVGNPVTYGEAPWGADTVTYFFAEIGVKTGTNLDYDWVYVQSTEVADETPEDGINYIKPLVFLWHCLAEGTLITLADGSQLPIEAIDNSNIVRVNQEGEVAKVVATSRAPARGGEVLHIKTADGQELILSKDHIVVTSEGPLKALQLIVGNSVLTLNGTTTITFISVSAYQGTLFNLHLAEESSENALTMFANGILVGDHIMQINHHKNAIKNKDYVMKHHLPEEWHVDYLSSLSQNQ